MIRTSIITLLICFCYLKGTAQKIDHLVSFRTIDSDNYFRFNYDNDYFAASDENYTQGYNLEFVSPFFKGNPINSLLIKPEDFDLKYALAIEHIGFTPDDYELPDIQFGDRPFAAAIMLKNSVVGKSTVKKLRLHTSLSLGLIGPGAFGEEMQVGIHKATGNKTPRGWRHQIKNDVVVNYNLGIEKQLINFNSLLSIQVQSNVSIGTLFTHISAGTNVVFGIFNNPFSSEEKTKTFQIYTYAQPVFTVVGYDATLQGGLFHTDSPYTISSEAIERFTFQFNYGLVIQTRTLYFEYTRSSITKEFNTGATAKWGGIKFGFTF
ncbi:lipid A deacylase LpxR family protein [Psychroserpens sp. SPM9]|uniref:lipid A deacylase LpxR family protein n=1 Tax=Psychroserpens sp. SPM9 TaxID=2975598 RepID=UPI0021A3B5BE|nr:lipid A deacylase LpxR family protein [Psychroserpens sp. SPM9]MDG5492418.1 lipid A deacylase LpxR family protein [Psychroserpens sp. SPM9]